jgi:hypothetical protein
MLEAASTSIASTRTPIVCEVATVARPDGLSYRRASRQAAADRLTVAGREGMESSQADRDEPEGAALG